jgi:anaphase-promoting complex subunit 10
MDVSITEKLEDKNCRELGKYAVWTLSTAKPGNGIEQLRDDSCDTYWQSDGQAPHLINIQFVKKVSVSKICMYLDFGTDESYTPKKVEIKSGSTFHDLAALTAIELHEPVGWVSVSLTEDDDGKDTEDSSTHSGPLPLRTHFLQIRIAHMHQNGRDAHVRQIKILGPRSSPKVMGGLTLDDFVSTEMLQYATLR